MRTNGKLILGTTCTTQNNMILYWYPPELSTTWHQIYVWFLIGDTIIARRQQKLQYHNTLSIQSSVVMLWYIQSATWKITENDEISHQSETGKIIKLSKVSLCNPAQKMARLQASNVNCDLYQQVQLPHNTLPFNIPCAIGAEIVFPITVNIYYTTHLLVL